VAFPTARRVLEDSIEQGAFPAASIEVGCEAGPLWAESFGRLSRDPDAAPTAAETIFDLASLTKVVATTSIVLRMVAAGRLNLETPLSSLLDGWADGSRASVHVRHLLDHSSGLAAHARFWEYAHGRAEIERAIRHLPLEREPGAASVYSDLGFMLLGFALEDRGARGLDHQFQAMAAEMDLGEIRYRPPAAWRNRTAPTEVDTWRGRLLVGEVHDENAAALDGVAGHAGLFGTASAVGRFARVVLQSFRQPTPLGTPELMWRAATRTGVPGSSRALGWDTMLPTSSCGARMTATAIGHTGFTGTSLWIDRERDLYVVLLTNRVHPTRENDLIVAARPRLHDAVVEDLLDLA
jgi:CubicO group peptidase (beta-lactamase class C family)